MKGYDWKNILTLWTVAFVVWVTTIMGTSGAIEPSLAFFVAMVVVVVGSELVGW